MLTQMYVHVYVEESEPDVNKKTRKMASQKDTQGD